MIKHLLLCTTETEVNTREMGKLFQICTKSVNAYIKSDYRLQVFSQVEIMTNTV